MNNVISQEIIENFLNGSDDEKYIVSVEYDYTTNKIYKILQDPELGKIIKSDDFTSFLWVGDLSSLNFYQKSKTKQKEMMGRHGILIEKLNTGGNERLEEGMTFLVKSIKSYTDLINFFKNGGIDPWHDKFKKYFTILSPVEQYLIQKKKRLFKGIEEYSDVHRYVFDIETTGLDPKYSEIILIGIKDNRGYKKTFDAFGDDGEKLCIINFFETLRELKPTIIGGYNSANFDFPFIIERCKILDLDISKLTSLINNKPLKEKEGTLKLASEVEKYTQHVFWGFNTIDIAHSVRRAQAINSEIKKWSLKYITKYLEKEKPNRVYVKGDEISKIYLSGDKYYVNPKTGGYRKVDSPGTENLLGRFPNVYEIWDGKQIVEQYLDDDLYETMIVDESFSQSTFLISKLVPTTYERVATMGTATLWKLIMLAWSYENNLALPKKEEKRKFTGGLSRLVRVGYSKDIVKFDFSSLYPSIQLVYDIFPECDIMGVQKSLLKYFRNVRIKYKHLAGEYKDKDIALSETYDRKQLPIKIFINGYFGSLSAPHVFPWGDINKGEEITCIGRQWLRGMVMFFMSKGYTPLVMDTDGVNFETPKDISNRKYIGLGNNELVVKGKEYIGVDADTAEFNDIFMRNEMGLDIDYISPVTINISRKNYIIKLIKKGKEKIKLTGNTIKSKKLAQYVIEFLDEGLKLLLNGDGLGFIELYYKHLTTIYNMDIPLNKIANKSRIKQTIENYKEHIKKLTKGGSLMARQAHMELLIHNNITPSLGDTVYYINNGTKKSQGDVQKVANEKYSKKEEIEYLLNNGKTIPKTYRIELNCYLIDEKEMLENPDLKGSYNVTKYIEKFNKTIKPLMVVFHPDIRNEIIVEEPNKRGYFTQNQCDLVNGFPLDEKGQDDLNEILTLSESEINFWRSMNKDPYLMYLEDSINSIDSSWVDSNREILNKTIENIEKHNDDDEIFSDDWLETPLNAFIIE